MKDINIKLAWISNFMGEIMESFENSPEIDGVMFERATDDDHAWVTLFITTHSDYIKTEFIWCVDSSSMEHYQTSVKPKDHPDEAFNTVTH